MNTINNCKLKITFLSNVDHLLHIFFNNIPANMHKYYYPNVLNPQASNTYVNIFSDMIYYKLLIKTTNDANNYLNSNYNNNYPLNKNSNTWTFYIYKNMMFELPFTLGNVIFIPYSYLKNSKTLVKTLIHEKLHTLQRENTSLWNNYIIDIAPEWIIINKNNKLFDKLSNNNVQKYINKIIIVNPDTCYADFKYIYKINNDLFYGILVLENNKVVTMWLLLDMINDDVSFTITNKLNLPIYEHPYETFVYNMVVSIYSLNL
jgi:hypothetical protein